MVAGAVKCFVVKINGALVVVVGLSFVFVSVIVALYWSPCVVGTQMLLQISFMCFCV